MHHVAHTYGMREVFAGRAFCKPSSETMHNDCSSILDPAGQGMRLSSMKTRSWEDPPLAYRLPCALDGGTSFMAMQFQTSLATQTLSENALPHDI